VVETFLRTWRNQHELRTLCGFLGLLVVLYWLFLLPNTENFEISGEQCAELQKVWSEKFQKDFRFSEETITDLADCTDPIAGVAQGLLLLSTITFNIPDDEISLNYYEWAKDLKPVFHTRPMISLALQEGFNSHVPCRISEHGFCDEALLTNPLDGGAYNYNFLLYHHIRQYSDASPANKRRAKRLMRETFEKRFNFKSADAAETYDLD